jgi:hypothetical protein
MGGRATTSRLLFAMLLAIIITSQGVHAWYNSIALARHAFYAPPSPSFAATTSVQRTSPSSLSTVQSPLSSKQIPKSSSSSSFALGVGNNNNNNNSYEELQSQLPSMGLNELQTQFRQAIAREDMDAAALYRNELADRVSSGAYRSNTNTEEEDVHRKRQRLSWAGLGTAPWLMERLQALEYPLPTTIQINAFEAVNAILADNNNNLNIATHDYSKNGADDDTLEERMQAQTPQNMGVVISGSTGR